MEELSKQSFEYFGALGIVIVGLMLLLGWVTKKWVGALGKIEELQEQRVKDAKAETSTQAQIGEAMRTTMAANTTALQAMQTILSRDGGRR